MANKRLRDALPVAHVLRARAKRITANQSDWQIEGWIVRLLTLSVLLAGSIAASGALAQSMNQDDLKWINQCIRDNRDEGASANVVRAYCVCMNEKMDSNETRSITQWEKSNPGAPPRLRAPGGLAIAWAAAQSGPDRDARKAALTGGLLLFNPGLYFPPAATTIPGTGHGFRESQPFVAGAAIEPS